MASRERCWVTKEWMDEMAEDRKCPTCCTKSCPINAGCVEGPEKVETNEDEAT